MLDLYIENSLLLEWRISLVIFLKTIFPFNGGVGALFANIEVCKPELTSLVFAVVVCIWHLAFGICRCCWHLVFAVVVGDDVQLLQVGPSLLLYLAHRVLLPYGSFFLLKYCLRPISYRRRRL